MIVKSISISYGNVSIPDMSSLIGSDPFHVQVAWQMLLLSTVQEESLETDPKLNPNNRRLAKTTVHTILNTCMVVKGSAVM